MERYPLFFKHSLFEKIHISQQGAVVFGSSRSISVESCFFFNISTKEGGSCIDLSSSTLNISESCFYECKNAKSIDETFSNIIKFLGTIFEVFMMSSHHCADTTDAGDSSIYAKSNSYNTAESNFSSNITPTGASVMRTADLQNHERTLVKRTLILDPGTYTAFECSPEIEISSSSFVNTTRCKLILQGPKYRLNHCAFINQCDVLCNQKLVSAVSCFSDRERPELKSTVSSFNVSFNLVLLEDCKKRVEQCLRMCSPQISFKSIYNVILFDLVI